MAPSKAGKRLLMVFQAYIDDSFKDGGAYVLAGFISTAERWAEFSAEWEHYVSSWGALDKQGQRHFKMSDMLKSEDRKDKIPAFYNLAKKYSIVSLSCTTNINYIRAANRRLYVPGFELEWDVLKTPFMICFRFLMSTFNANRRLIDSYIPNDATIDFIFDNQSEKGIILRNWDDFVEKQPPEMRRFYRNSPRFEDDKAFLPLQAADLWAGQIRIWTEAGIASEELDKLSEGFPLAECRRLAVHITFNEDDIVADMKNLIKGATKEPIRIYDITYGPWPTLLQT